MQDRSTGEVKLTRDMSLFQVLMIGIGAMIGAGIFVLIGTAAGQAGPGILLAFALNGVIAFMTAAVYAELGAAMPAAGGGYVWVQHGIGGVLGFLTGWLQWFAHSVACSVYCIGFGLYLASAIAGEGRPVMGLPPDTFAKFAAAGAILIFGWINFRGASEAGRAEAVVTIGKLLVLALFIGSGLWALRSRAGWQEQFTPFFPGGFPGVLAAMGIIYIAFEGYEIVAQCGEEIVDPKRNLPRATFLSLAIVVVFYILIAFVALGAVEPPEGRQSWQFLGELRELAVIEAARQFMVGGQSVGMYILLIGGLMSTLSALNATIYSSSRVALAMGRDVVLPERLAAVHPKRRTPHNALALSLSIIASMALLLPLEDVASAANIVFLLLFLLVNLAAIVLRYRRPDLERPYRAPFLPVLPIVAIIAQFALAAHLFTFSPIAWYVSFGWIVAGFGLFYAYSRQRHRKRAVTPVAVRQPTVAEGRYTVLTPIGRPDNLTNLVTVASALAGARHGAAALLNVVQVPMITPLSSADRQVDAAQELLGRAAEICRSRGVPSWNLVRVAHRTSRAILDTVEEERPNLLVLGWRGWTADSDRTLGATIDPVVRNAQCDVAVLKATRPISQVERVVVAVTGSPQARLTVSCGATLADALGARALLVHFAAEESTTQDRAHQLMQEFTDLYHRPVMVHRCLRMPDGMTEFVTPTDLLVIGATWHSLAHQAFFGSVTHDIARSVSCSVLMVRRYPGHLRTRLRELLTPMDVGDFAAFDD